MNSVFIRSAGAAPSCACASCHGRLLFRDISRNLRRTHNNAIPIPNRRNGERDVDQPTVLAHSHGFEVIHTFSPPHSTGSRLLRPCARAAEAVGSTDYHLRLEYPNIRSAPMFQLVTMPFRFLRDDRIVGGSTIAASSNSGDRNPVFAGSPFMVSAWAILPLAVPPATAFFSRWRPFTPVVLLLRLYIDARDGELRKLLSVALLH